jgi:hypothetical protein
MRKFILILLTFIFILSSCRKEDSVDNSDDADRYVGTYSYNMTSTGGMIVNIDGSCTIAKVSAKRVSITIGTSTTPNMYYTVNGNIMTEETCTSNIPVSGGGTLEFVENGNGSINGNMLTIYATDTYPGYPTIYFKIICTKQ